MIWEATLQPKTFRAWGYSESPAFPDCPGGHLWNNMEWRWLLLECNPYRWAHIPLYSVCRLSRALALSTYGTPGPASGWNFTFLHPDLDTIEVLGHNCEEFGSKVYMWPLISREPSETRGIENVAMQVEATISDRLRIYWGQETLNDEDETPVDNRSDWLIFGRQFDKARRVILCHDLRVPFRLTEIAEWAGVMFPNIEALTLRAYIDPLKGDPDAHASERNGMGRYVNQVLLARKTGQWGRLRTIDFTRQSVPDIAPDEEQLEAWDDEFGPDW